MSDVRRDMPGVGSGRELPTDEESRFLSDLLDALARQDGRAHAALIWRNPDLLEIYGESERLRSRIRQAAGADESLLPQGARELIVRIRDAWGEHRLRPGDSVEIGAGESDDVGILTSLTRRLPPHKAMELFRKITPVLVYQVLSRMNESAHIPVVCQFVDHFCSAEVQARLRACEHVRDGILDEFCRVLDRSEIRRNISSRELETLLVEGGAMNELIAMENCIKLVASRAG